MMVESPQPPELGPTLACGAVVGAGAAPLGPGLSLPSDMSVGGALLDRCHSNLLPPQLPPPAASLLPRRPPNAAAEFDRRAATADPPSKLRVPKAATAVSVPTTPPGSLSIIATAFNFRVAPGRPSRHHRRIPPL